MIGLVYVAALLLTGSADAQFDAPTSRGTSPGMSSTSSCSTTPSAPAAVRSWSISSAATRCAPPRFLAIPPSTATQRLARRVWRQFANSFATGPLDRPGVEAGPLSQHHTPRGCLRPSRPYSQPLGRRGKRKGDALKRERKLGKATLSVMQEREPKTEGGRATNEYPALSRLSLPIPAATDGRATVSPGRGPPPGRCRSAGGLRLAAMP